MRGERVSVCGTRLCSSMGGVSPRPEKVAPVLRDLLVLDLVVTRLRETNTRRAETQNWTGFRFPHCGEQGTTQFCRLFPLLP